MSELASLGVGSRPFFGLFMSSQFSKMGLFKNESYPVAEKLARRGFYVPSGMALKESQMDKVVNAIKK